MIKFLLLEGGLKVGDSLQEFLEANHISFPKSCGREDRYLNKLVLLLIQCT